ncbi:hypothetical protein EC973_002655 [Apophysomyces ossiformis]|uniref:Protein kinase domain-containing protein n=1 Tax=Apophysomyces ossiformis TaxID=679940 RepID=A0A8H7BIT5_9FUNG|nr:hypothetical protein EC973_002655 [Apophysomyces ossiformis]
MDIPCLGYNDNYIFAITSAGILGYERNPWVSSLTRRSTVWWYMLYPHTNYPSYKGKCTFDPWAKKFYIATNKDNATDRIADISVENGMNPLLISDLPLHNNLSFNQLSFITTKYNSTCWVAFCGKKLEGCDGTKENLPDSIIPVQERITLARSRLSFYILQESSKIVKVYPSYSDTPEDFDLSNPVIWYVNEPIPQLAFAQALHENGSLLLISTPENGSSQLYRLDGPAVYYEVTSPSPTAEDNQSYSAPSTTTNTVATSTITPISYNATLTKLRWPRNLDASQSISFIITDSRNLLTKRDDALSRTVYFVQQGMDGQIQIYPKSLDAVLNGEAGQPPGLGPSVSGTPEADLSAPTAKDNTGTIVGAVIGGVVGIALIAGLLLWSWRRKQNKRKKMVTEHDLFMDKGLMAAASSNNVLEHNSTGTETYPDFLCPIDVPPTDLHRFEPDWPGDATLRLGGVDYVLLPDTTYYDSYVTRTCQLGEETYTLHYFLNTAQPQFTISAYLARTIASSNVIQHCKAFELRPQTLHGYQFIWITSPCIPHQSLEHLLSGTNRVVDIGEFPFKVWSVYSILKSVADIHAQRYVHLNLSPSCYFYEKASSVTEWRLAALDQSLCEGAEAIIPQLNAYSAPELHNPNVTANPSADIWSLGCIVYTIATGKQLFDTAEDTLQPHIGAQIIKAWQEAGKVHQCFGELLEGMLQADPMLRLSADKLLTQWVTANALDDEEEDEDEEGREGQGRRGGKA